MYKQENNDFSTLIAAETEIFSKNIELLKSWRAILWDSADKGATGYLISQLDDIYELKDSLTEFKQYAPTEIYESFVQEYDMTMYLLNKCLIKATNKNFLPASEEDNLKITEMISKLSIYEQENINIESTVSALRKEDPTVRKTLESLGFPESKIEEIVASGYKVESVLDEEPNIGIKK